MATWKTIVSGSRAKVRDDLVEQTSVEHFELRKILSRNQNIN